MIILAPTAPVLFLYDVADTAGAPLAEPSAAKSSHGNVSLREIFRRTKANSDLHGICPRLIPGPEIESEIVIRLTAATRNRYRDLDLSSKASYLIMLNDQAARAENYRNLVSGLGQIFCGHYGIDANAWWPERAALSAETEKIEAQSVTYLVCGRQGATGTEAPFLTPYLGGAQAMPPFGLNAVIQAAGYIEEMGKRQWSAPKKKSRYRS